MTQHQYQSEKEYFGKYQRLVAIFMVMTFFELPFFLSIAFILYGIFTLNIQLLIFFVLIILIAFPIKRSQTYIRLVRKYVVPTSYYKNFYRIFDQKIPEGEKALFCFHPHSVFAYCLISNMNCGNDSMTKMVGLCSRFILNIPFTGIIFRLFGVESVNPQNLKKIMKKGKNIGLLPGGFQEATLTTPKQLRIFIKQRYGFIKYALKYGYTLYPTITFNQHKQFETFDHWHNLRLKINKLKFPGVFFISKFFIFLNPEFQMITVVGKGIKLEKTAANQNYQPTKQQILQIQHKYIDQIQRLYNSYKHLNQNVSLAIY